ncbi:LEAF RUST 10 DISEASE-RESISTANCE LOCUS RECEPTOR-LIKE PROTEIN KINASE-like 1.2 [Zingiber officinale]|uniref:LEAF RUST 10 DISEASE-RESISTANCE LOCUS RECEPTOR-LIKE PROTEIN KINASE-like 1.2 n=1 Tax=Zingiber officinale TaxID=94328 RepID=UPI001C4ACECC|nr:LEAF RUST 10 DISEASE-RESISTANCE LOCUS RECEPTOR-LIKE PROTEIN KINASE-like 1.2 [Zingiber officinale]XP_042458063.1 LEAF RUST 10 DISEASE-RESISTANCE LOCUS RECEPTOR-LIKE PROTEIN KINASE-like 1.2 [Zingiber officinale]
MVKVGRKRTPKVLAAIKSQSKQGKFVSSRLVSSRLLFQLCVSPEKLKSMESPAALILVLIFSLLSSMASSSYYRYADCAPFLYPCGHKKFNVSYPFHVDGHPNYCGYPGYFLWCDKEKSCIMININGRSYQVKNVDYVNHLIDVVDRDLLSMDCPVPTENASIASHLYGCSDRDRNATVFSHCDGVPQGLDPINCSSGAAAGRRGYYTLREGVSAGIPCNSTVVVPMHQGAADRLAMGELNFSNAVADGFSVSWTAGRGWCSDCINSGGLCGFDGSSPTNNNTCYCSYGSGFPRCSKGRSGHRRVKIVIGSVAAAGVLVLLCACFLCLKRKRNRMHSPSSKFLDRNASFKPNLKDAELNAARLQTHLFSYDELLQATNRFDPSNELGDGGFGTVYKGKLRDGRTIAVKRLYENNCRRLEQFVNEIEILSRLRHQNLVSLYGCTSPRSRGLLLAYEFVPNGTVADHLHGRRAGEGVLTWPVRLGIAIETADALAYLHAVNPPIIHRDVKTCNVLLDGSFRVKVADFGLSRLFPEDATHVSTAPQGTPGYLDPEYHRCYQLTSKSDVYSFGVMLVELISSKPAVDMARDRSEINLSSMAVARIQNGDLEQLVDAGLGYRSDQATRKMIAMVAEVAFRCLQADGNMRPSIKEVLDELRAIEIEGRRKVAKSGDDDDVSSNKGAPTSPDTVMNKWISGTTISNASEHLTRSSTNAI